MITIKTEELIGAKLDYAVAKALGHEAEIKCDEKGTFCLKTEILESGSMHTGSFFPSTEWHHGGPIIDQAMICVGPHTNYRGKKKRFIAAIDCVFGGGDDVYFGDTHLIAAMRCFVGSRLGNEVEVSA